MAAEFYIYHNGVRCGLLQQVQSVQWLEAYREVGEVCITARLTADNLRLLREGARVYCTATQSAMVLTQREIHDTPAAATLTARGMPAAGLLAHRVVQAAQTVTTVEEGLLALCQNNLRGLPLQLAPAVGLPGQVQAHVAWGSVLQALESLCAESGLGFRTLFDADTAAETLQLYAGADRRFGQSGYCGHFGEGAARLTEVRCTLGEKNYKNVAVVAGEKQSDGSRTVVTAQQGEAAGESRRELFVDAAGVHRTHQVAVPTGQTDSNGSPTYTYHMATYTEDEYRAVLAEKGLQALAEHTRTLQLQCQVSHELLRYGRDYALGDLLSFQLPRLGLVCSGRVLRAVHVFEGEGEKLALTFGDFAFG